MGSEVKALAFSFVLMATLSGCFSVARCEERINFKAKLSIPKEDPNQKAERERLEKECAKFVQDRLCPSGWKESEYRIFTGKPGRTYTEGNALVTEIDMGLPLDTCKDNGLLRLRP